MPKRGAIALGLTALALVLLLNFQTPGDARDAGGLDAVGILDELGRRPARADDLDLGRDLVGAPRRRHTAGGPRPTARPAGIDDVDGPEVDTRYGPVQVSVTVANGQVTDVIALQLPVGRPVGPDLERGRAHPPQPRP